MLIADVALISGIATNGVVVNAYKASRFPSWNPTTATGGPALNDPPPSGGADAGPVTSGVSFGGQGYYILVTPTTEGYFLSGTFGGQTAWEYKSGDAQISDVTAAVAVETARAEGVESGIGLALSDPHTWTAAQTLPLVDAGGQSYNVKAYGAFGDLYVAPSTGQMTAGSNALTLSSGSFPSLSTTTMTVGNPVYVQGAQDQVFSDCVFNGTATITSASAMFQALHLGHIITSTAVTVPGGTKIIGILNAGAGAILSAAVTGSATGNLVIQGTGVLAGFVGAGTTTSQINIVTTSGGVTAQNALRDVTAASVQVGHDDTAAIQAAIDAAMMVALADVTPGGEVLIPAGTYGVTTLNCWLSGTAFNAGTLVIQGAGIDNTTLVSMASLMASSGQGNFGHVIVPLPPSATATTVPRVAFRDLTFDDGYWAASSSPCGPPFATATIASGSNGVALSGASVVNVSTTTEFATNGHIDVQTTTGTFRIAYGSITATSFGTLTISANVTGTMSTGKAVSGDATSSLTGIAARAAVGGMFGTSSASGNTVIINLPYPYQGNGGRWAGLSGTTTGAATKTTLTLSGTPLTSVTDYANVLKGALIAVDTDLADAGPPAVSCAWGLIDGVLNDGTNDIVSLESSFWMDTFYPGPYQVNGGVPVGSGGTITWTVQVSNYRGTLHEFRRVRFYRPRGFVSQPTKGDFQQCVFDQCGQPRFSEVVHQDVLGSSGTTAVVNDCDYIGGHGNYVDFQGNTAAFPCVQFTNNRGFGVSGFCNVAGLGMGSIISGNRLYNLSNNGSIKYDSAQPQSCNGWNVVSNNAGNLFVNLAPDCASSAFGSRVNGNVAPDSPFGPWTVSPPAVPASGTAYVPTKGCDFGVYIAWTGTGTCAIAITPPNGTPTTLRTLAAGNVTTQNFHLRLPAGGTGITLTYTGGTPTWLLVGD